MSLYDPEVGTLSDGVSVLTSEELVYIRNRTSADCRKTSKKDCAHCKYACDSSGESSGGANVLTCNYIIITGRRRPCLPGRCRESGVFEAGRRVDTRRFTTPVEHDTYEDMDKDKVID